MSSTINHLNGFDVLNRALSSASKLPSKFVTDVAKPVAGYAGRAINAGSELITNPVRSAESIGEGSLNAAPGLVNDLSRTGASIMRLFGASVSKTPTTNLPLAGNAIAQATGNTSQAQKDIRGATAFAEQTAGLNEGFKTISNALAGPAPQPIQDIKLIQSASGGYDQSAINHGDVLKTGAGQARIDDVIEQLDQRQPGLGETFKKLVNPNNVRYVNGEPVDLINTANDLLQGKPIVGELGYNWSGGEKGRLWSSVKNIGSQSGIQGPMGEAHYVSLDPNATSMFGDTQHTELLNKLNTYDMTNVGQDFIKDPLYKEAFIKTNGGDIASYLKTKGYDAVRFIGDFGPEQAIAPGVKLPTINPMTVEPIKLTPPVPFKPVLATPPINLKNLFRRKR